jgi:hypothetical protein
MTQIANTEITEVLVDAARTPMGHIYTARGFQDGELEPSYTAKSEESMRDLLIQLRNDLGEKGYRILGEFHVFDITEADHLYWATPLKDL